MSLLGPLLRDSRILELLGFVGTPYWYGHGTPASQWPPKDCDCSGWVQMSLVRLGIYRSTEPDRKATADLGPLKCLANICYPTPSPHMGDIAFYPGHCMLCLGGEWVLGATGGTSITKGDDPKACVKLERFDYRKDFLTFGTLIPEHRVS